MVRLLVLALVLLLPACGFEPVYGKRDNSDNPALAAFDQVEIGSIPDQNGQRLRNRLMDRLYREGRPASPRYILMVSPLNERLLDLDITKSADATRGQLRLTSSLRLLDRQTNTILLTRPLTSITSYNILGSEFTNRVAEDNARQNAIEDLARQIETQLSLYFRNPAPPPVIAAPTSGTPVTGVREPAY
jgi:LPS-assembly lipoprotein